jgi:2-keto-4-pentenoate hydratase
MRSDNASSDNASSGGVVLGSAPSALSANDLRLVGCNLYHNGVLAGTGAGGAVLGSPLNSLVWLAVHFTSLGSVFVPFPAPRPAARDPALRRDREGGGCRQATTAAANC